jgi:hypothetical protein
MVDKSPIVQKHNGEIHNDKIGVDSVEEFESWAGVLPSKLTSIGAIN